MYLFIYFGSFSPSICDTFLDMLWFQFFYKWHVTDVYSSTQTQFIV